MATLLQVATSPYISGWAVQLHCQCAMEDIGGMSLRTVIRHRFFATLDFENWLYTHLMRHSTLGCYLKREVILLNTDCAKLVRCCYCGGIHFALAPGELVRIFHKQDRRVANTVFNMYKQSRNIMLPADGIIRMPILMSRWI